MKKSLILLPLAAIMLSGCLPLPGGETSGTSAGGSGASATSQTSTSGGSATFTPAPTVAPATLPTTHEASFDVTPGNHIVTLDFTTDYETYKSAFPRVEATTGLIGMHLAGMATMTNNCFVGSYNNVGYLMMKNKDDYATNNGAAFIGNCASLGAITHIEFTAGSSASTSQKYDITLSKELVKEPGTSGTEISHPSGSVDATVADGYGYFRITTKDTSKNGQTGKLIISYTIS